MTPAPWWGIGLALLWSLAGPPAEAAPATYRYDDLIPAFARKYRTSCSTCHTAAPKLNVLGEAFRLNGYRLPENDRLLRKDQPVPLGSEPWRDLWPRAIWPGEVSGFAPLALRLQNDAGATRSPEGTVRWSYRFPNEVALLAGSALGETIAAYLDLAWNPTDGLEVEQANLAFQDVLPWLPSRLANLGIGVQNLRLFTLGDPVVDGAGRAQFLWQTFRVADLELRGGIGAPPPRSEDVFQLGHPQPTIELNGLVRPRLYYAVGLSQGAGPLADDNNAHKDLYYKLRYKLGGLRLDGTYAPGGGPLTGSQGQLLDRALIVESFGYFGSEPTNGVEDAHRSFGLNARMLWGPLDLGGGYVWGRHEQPWGSGSGPIRYGSAFGKAEYLVFPWFIAALKAEALHLSLPGPAVPSGATGVPADQTRVIPGVVILVRQNIRGVVEAELFRRHDPSRELAQATPHNLWIRLDVAF
ncbi:MAG: hypothetical protein HY700_06860 [Gemmatimonadetes bacterium]|nr:hypothetical protein [Gemmatimonadota bacterium]